MGGESGLKISQPSDWSVTDVEHFVNYLLTLACGAQSYRLGSLTSPHNVPHFVLGSGNITHDVLCVFLPNSQTMSQQHPLCGRSLYAW